MWFVCFFQARKILIKTKKLNVAAYIEVQETAVKHWINSVCSGIPYIFLQDSALSHKAQRTQECMANNLYDHITPNIWPHNFPDLNPLDNYVWRVVEKEVNEYPHKTKDSLKAAIARVMSDTNKEQLFRACNRDRPRIEALIDASGGFSEKIYHSLANFFAFYL